jgi:K+-transporting ATPase KdpF subunit
VKLIVRHDAAAFYPAFDDHRLVGIAIFTAFLYSRATSWQGLYARFSILTQSETALRGEKQHGPDLCRWNRRFHGTMHRADQRMRTLAPSRRGGPSMNAWAMWLAAASTLLLFVYLVYALLRAEDLE